jgi:hypothetical protein
MPTPSESHPCHDTIATLTPTRTVTAHRCESLMRDGNRCTRDVATVFRDGEWRCPSHRPKAPKTGEPRVHLPRPPVTDLKEPGDTVRLASWAAIQAARRRLPKQYASVVLDACREFRAGWALAKDTRLSDELIKATCAYWDALMAHNDPAAEAASRKALAVIGELLGHRPGATVDTMPGPRSGEVDHVWGERLG